MKPQDNNAPIPPNQSNQTTPPPPQVVYMSRPLNPQDPHISDEVRKLHEASKAKHPELNLSEGEYIISAITRHPIGLFEIWGFVGLLSILLFVALPFYATNKSAFDQFIPGVSGSLPSAALLSIPVILLIGIFILGGVIATYVYLGNKFYLTNESVIQIIRVSMFSTKEQTISLGNIEDASFKRHGVLQTVLNYGSLRLSTEGDETTYRYNFVAQPRDQVAKLNNAVESFKNGRPVDTDEN